MTQERKKGICYEVEDFQTFHLFCGHGHQTYSKLSGHEFWTILEHQHHVRCQENVGMKRILTFWSHFCEMCPQTRIRIPVFRSNVNAVTQAFKSINTFEGNTRWEFFCIYRHNSGQWSVSSFYYLWIFHN